MTNRDWFWILLGILGLILMYFLCFGAQKAAPVAATAPAAGAVVTAPQPAAPPPAVAQPAPPPVPSVAPTPVSASVAAEYGAGKVTLLGTVPDEAARMRIVEQAKSTFGGNNVIDKLAIDPAVSALAWFGSGALLAPFRIKGLPAGRAELDGKRIVLTGEVVSDAIKSAIGSAVKQQVGADIEVDNRLTVAAAVVQKRKLDDMLRGKTIEFETGSAIITVLGRKLLDETVPVIQEDRATRIEVAGHTDNVGDAPSNKRLSDLRANSVLAYLVAKGVARDRLSARGYGQEKPIADNGTVDGRARNRRIDFHVQEGGK